MKVPVVTKLDGDGEMPTPPLVALDLIRTAWWAWGSGELTEVEFAAGVAEALEGAGYRLAKDVR